MYVPNSLRMEPASQIEQFIHAHGFGIVVSQSLQASHLPFLFDSQVGKHGELYSHLAKANPQSQQLDGQPVLIIFNGPHSYISPTWYESGPAVPTWNYAAVHIYGKIEILDDSHTLHIVQETVKKYEAELLNDQSVMPVDYQQKLCKAITSFKVTISRIEAKHKLGQQRRIADQMGVYIALKNSSDLDAKQLADYMLQTGVGCGKNEGNSD